MSRILYHNDSVRKFIRNGLIRNYSSADKLVEKSVPKQADVCIIGMIYLNRCVYVLHSVIVHLLEKYGIANGLYSLL